MELWHIPVLFLLGLVSSGINAVAGGGSLVSFPGLHLWLGIPSIPANATNGAGHLLGSAAGGLGFRSEFAKVKQHFFLLLAPTIVGSLIGAWLLLISTEKTFKQIIPWLILFAAILLLLQPRVKRMLVGEHKPKFSRGFAVCVQLFVAIYGGYFGAGMGIMMLASFALSLDATTHELNAIKNWLALIINVACTSVFVFKHLVLLPQAGVMAIGGILGGYLTARWSLSLDPEKLRIAIALYGICMALYFFVTA
jgi:hypothetical protein